TTGLRESVRYDSLRAPTNSISSSLCLIIAVPKRLYTFTEGCGLNLVATNSANWIQSPRQTISISFDSLPMILSRIYPPMANTFTPISFPHSEMMERIFFSEGSRLKIRDWFMKHKQTKLQQHN